MSVEDFRDVRDFPAGEYMGRIIKRPHWLLRKVGFRIKRNWFGVVLVSHSNEVTSMHWTSHGEWHSRAYGHAVIADFRHGQISAVYRQAITMWPVRDAVDANAIAADLCWKVRGGERVETIEDSENG